MNISANGIELEVQDWGSPAQPCVFLLIGLGLQLTHWPKALISGLLNSGFRVIAMDNRDSGLSKCFDDAGVPNLLWNGLKSKLGMHVQLPYGLQDMAQDAFGVMDALGVESAHVFGMSMGGMIAQRMAFSSPERVLSMVSMMSTSSAPGLPAPDAKLLRQLFPVWPSKDESAGLEHAVDIMRALSAERYGDDLPTLRSRAQEAVQRSWHPSGVARQLAAVMLDDQRYLQLSEITSASLIVHGSLDPLIPVACGWDVHQRIAQSRWWLIEGLAHELPFKLIPVLLPPLLEFFHEHS